MEFKEGNKHLLPLDERLKLARERAISKDLEEKAKKAAWKDVWGLVKRWCIIGLIAFIILMVLGVSLVRIIDSQAIEQARLMGYAQCKLKITNETREEICTKICDSYWEDWIEKNHNASEIWQKR